MNKTPITVLDAENILYVYFLSRFNLVESDIMPETFGLKFEPDEHFKGTILIALDNFVKNGILQTSLSGLWVVHRPLSELPRNILIPHSTLITLSSAYARISTFLNLGKPEKDITRMNGEDIGEIAHLIINLVQVLENKGKNSAQ